MSETKPRIVDSLFRALVAERNPRQLALAVALGFGIGLVPKLNLIAVGWLVLLFICRANLLAGLCAAAFASLIGLAFDPYLHRFGDLLLHSEWLRPWFAAIYKLPLGPWTSINNTVVAAATTIGLLQLIPTYSIARSFFTRRFDQLNNHWIVKASRTEASTGWRI